MIDVRASNILLAGKNHPAFTSLTRTARLLPRARRGASPIHAHHQRPADKTCTPPPDLDRRPADALTTHDETKPVL